MHIRRIIHRSILGLEGFGGGASLKEPFPLGMTEEYFSKVTKTLRRKTFCLKWEFHHCHPHKVSFKPARRASTLIAAKLSVRRSTLQVQLETLEPPPNARSRHDTSPSPVTSPYAPPPHHRPASPHQRSPDHHDQTYPTSQPLRLPSYRIQKSLEKKKTGSESSPLPLFHNFRSCLSCRSLQHSCGVDRAYKVIKRTYRVVTNQSRPENF